LIRVACRDQPTVKQLINSEALGSLEGFVFKPETCRKAFDHFDKDKNGYLDAAELLKLAGVSDPLFLRKYCTVLAMIFALEQKLWDTFFPQGPQLSEADKTVRFDMNSG
jgi:hypothetical protein